MFSINFVNEYRDKMVLIGFVKKQQQNSWSLKNTLIKEVRLCIYTQRTI